MTLDAFEESLDAALASVDHALEAKWGGRWPLHPARPEAGRAANPRYDGLFRVTAAFTAGYGSEKGRGYLVRVEIATLAAVSDADRRAIESDAAGFLQTALADAFPGRDLRVERDGPSLKIVGDLSL